MHDEHQSMDPAPRAAGRRAAARLAAARRVLVVPPARGPADLGPALARLRRSLPDATLVMLASASCPLADELLPDDEWTHLDVKALPTLIDRLAAAALDAALVFTDEHESAFEVATLAYLAGVPLRAGLDDEFDGGVLAPWLRPPREPLPPAGRHLYLLRALGL
jgi:ADP-heptose:LPS heptosyltransferase